jgi:CBS domain-containing protein
MTCNAEVIGPKATMAEAARQMEALDVGVLPVCDGERLVGMLTDRDLRVGATAAGRNPSTSAVGEVMMRDLVSVREDQDISEAIA